MHVKSWSSIYWHFRTPHLFGRIISFLGWMRQILPVTRALIILVRKFGLIFGFFNPYDHYTVTATVQPRPLSMRENYVPSSVFSQEIRVDLKGEELMLLE